MTCISNSHGNELVTVARDTNIKYYAWSTSRNVMV